MQRWITFDKLYPMPNEMVEIERDGQGRRCNMRIPCRAFTEMTSIHADPDRLFRYRLNNRPKVGDEVLLKYIHSLGPFANVSEGVICRINGGYIYLLVEIRRGAEVKIREMEVYDNEIIVKADRDFMELHGTL